MFITSHPYRLITIFAVVTGLAAPLALAERQRSGDLAKGREVFDNLNFAAAERHREGSGSILPATLTEAPSIAEAETTALERAEQALEVAPMSVTQKSRVAPSGNPHDYASTAPYFWPDPSKPDGLPYIRHDGKIYPGSRTNESDIQRSGTLNRTVSTLARAYAETHDEKYAARAGHLLRTWFLDPATYMRPHLEYAQGIPGVNSGRQIGIIEGGSIIAALEQASLLSGSTSWTAADQTALMKWTDEFLTWYLTSAFGVKEGNAANNHGTHYDVQVMRMALMLDQKDLVRRVAEAAKLKRIAAQIEPDGRQPHELTRATSFSYSQMNLRGLMSLASLADGVGVDLWHYESPDGRSIRKALDFLAPYLKDSTKAWPYEQIKDIDRGGFSSMLRQAAKIYHESEYDVIAESSLGHFKVKAGSGVD